MIPSAQERDRLFKAFGRAFFRQDLDALYEVVTDDFAYSILLGDQSRRMTTRQQVADFLVERKHIETQLRFEDVVYHHAEDASFMTFRMTGIDVQSSAAIERAGIERYSFRDGLIAEKDVFYRPLK